MPRSAASGAAGSQLRSFSLPDLAKTAVPIATSLLLVVLVVVKVLIVAHGDTATALAVVSASDKATVILGILVQYLWALLAFPFFGILVFLMQTNTPPSVAVRSLLAVCGLAIAIISPIVPAALLVIACVLILIFGRRVWAPSRSTAIGFVVGILLATATSVFGDQPWLPTRRIETTSRQSVIGYVVSRTSERVTILTAHSRKLEDFDTASILRMPLCESGPERSFDNRPVLSWLTSPNLPYSSC